MPSSWATLIIYKGVEPFSLPRSTPWTDAIKKKQSYSTPARYEVHNGQKPTDSIIRRQAECLRPSPLLFENCPDFRAGRRKTPSQYVMLPCDSKGKIMNNFSFHNYFPLCFLRNRLSAFRILFLISCFVLPEKFS